MPGYDGAGDPSVAETELATLWVAARELADTTSVQMDEATGSGSSQLLVDRDVGDVQAISVLRRQRAGRSGRSTTSTLIWSPIKSGSLLLPTAAQSPRCPSTSRATGGRDTWSSSAVPVTNCSRRSSEWRHHSTKKAGVLLDSLRTGGEGDPRPWMGTQPGAVRQYRQVTRRGVASRNVVRLGRRQGGDHGSFLRPASRICRGSGEAP